MNVKTTIILLVLLILCMGYVLVFHTDWFGRQPVKPEDPTELDKRLTGDAGKVRRLVLERPGIDKIVFVRSPDPEAPEGQDDKWRIAEPIDAPATEWQVSSAASTVSTLRYVRKYAADDPERPRDDLAHLSAPLWIVTFTDDKNKTYRIKVGQKAPLGRNQTYVQLAGDDNVYVVQTDLHASLDKTLADYRQKDVTRFDADKAVRVEVRGDEKYQLVKIDEKWNIDSPVSARAVQDKVKSLLRVVSEISADKFIDDAPKSLAPYGLDNPRLQVTVELAAPKPTTTASAPASKPASPKKGKVVSVAFGAVADEKVFAKLADKPWVFQVDESLLKDLQPKLTDLREKHVLDIADKEITKIETLLSAGGSATLEKVDEKWRMRRPFEGAGDDDAIPDLIGTLGSLKAEEFQDNPTATTLAAAGLKPPKGRIVLHFRGSDLTTTLLLGRTSSSGQMGFVMPEGGKSVAVVPAGNLAKLLRPSPAYRDKTIFKLPDEATVTQVDLDRPDGKFTVAATDGDEFKLTRPVSAETDSENVKALLEAVRNIRADKIAVLNKTLPKRFARAKKVIRVRLTYRTPAPATQPATASAPATQTTTTAPTTTQASQPATQPARFKTHHASPLVVTREKGKSHVWLEGASPFVVGELAEGFYDKFAAEMRDRTILKIDAEKTTSLKMDMEKTSMEFVRSGRVWRYTADSFVKIDAGKIRDFLLGLSGIKAERFVDYSAKPDLKRFGLDKPAMTIILKTDAAREIRLKIARTGPVGTRGLYAASSECPGVFVLAPEAPKKMIKSLKDFQKK